MTVGSRARVTQTSAGAAVWPGGVPAAGAGRGVAVLGDRQAEVAAQGGRLVLAAQRRPRSRRIGSTSSVKRANSLGTVTRDVEAVEARRPRTSAGSRRRPSAASPRTATRRALSMVLDRLAKREAVVPRPVLDLARRCVRKLLLPASCATSGNGASRSYWREVVPAERAAELGERPVEAPVAERSAPPWLAGLLVGVGDDR